MKSNGRLKYDFDFKALPPSAFSDFGHDYSNSKLEIKFGRTEKSRSKIFGGYYMESEIFAMLSLISFFIHSDSVPGKVIIHKLRGEVSPLEQDTIECVS